MAKKQGITRREIDLQFRFGSTVRERRLRLGISQEELGSRAGLHRTYITDIERGARNISLKSVARLSKALEVSMGSLFETSTGSALGGAGARRRSNGGASARTARSAAPS